MERLPVTVVIPTLNAGRHLVELLDSIGEAVSDIQILDSRSTDSTVDIALARGIKIVQRAFTTHGDHFQWMVSNMPVKTEWVFLLAQDERFTPSLLDALKRFFSGIADLNGYTVRWRLWFMGKPLHVVVDNVRLVRMGHFRIADVVCNEQILVDGPVGRIDGVLEHKDSLTLHDWYEKQNLYSTMEAIAYAAGEGGFAVTPALFRGRLARRMMIKKLFFRIPFRYFWVFLYNFLLMGAWRDGKVGFIWARLRSDVYRMWEYKVTEMDWSGVIPEVPRSAHGDFDRRVMATVLQQELLPDVFERWQANLEENDTSSRKISA